MRIALLASAFHPHMGGVEELTRQLAHAHQTAGHDVCVITNRWPRNLPAYELYEGIPVHRIAFRAPSPDNNLKARLGYCISKAKTLQELTRVLTEHRSDVVHIQCISVGAHYALAAKKILRFPLVVTTQGERMKDKGPLFEGSRFMTEMLRATLAAADYITACSADTLRDMERWYGAEFTGRSQPVYNGMRLADFEDVAPYSHPRPFVLGLGRLIHKKGFDLLLQAYRDADLRSHDLLIAGDGDQRVALEAKSRELGLQARVHFMGPADRRTAISLFLGCDLFVLPSRIEPQGIVNLEAMAASKPILGARVGGVPEIVEDEITGVLVDNGDVDGFAAGLKRLCTDRALREKLGTAGRNRAEDYDWKNVAEKYVALYQRVQT